MKQLIPKAQVGRILRLVGKSTTPKLIGVVKNGFKKLLPRVSATTESAFKDPYGREITPTPYQGTDEALAKNVELAQLATLRDYFKNNDKIQQIQTTMGWGDKEIKELQKEIMRSIGTLADVQVKGPKDGFTIIARHTGEGVGKGKDMVGRHTVTLNRERIPDDKTALEGAIHELGGHGKTMGIDTKRVLTNKNYQDFAVAFPRLTDLMIKNGELAKSILKPNDTGLFYASFPNSSDLELFIEKNKGALTNDDIDDFFKQQRYYKYLNTDQEKYARAYTALLMEKLGYNTTLNEKLLKKFFTDESVNLFKKAVLGLSAPWLISTMNSLDNNK